MSQTNERFLRQVLTGYGLSDAQVDFVIARIKAMR